MAIRTIIFCDRCNPQGIRQLDARSDNRGDPRLGRRRSDGRAWIEAETKHHAHHAGLSKIETEISEIIKHGWVCTPDGRHICPDCPV